MLKITIEILSSPAYSFFNSSVHFKLEKTSFNKTRQKNNQFLSKERVINENAIGLLKRFKILADRYRNRRKRFGLRFNLIAGIYNLELC
nr:transposase family protein [Candidatus Rhabdochlamydia oedothoracis]